MKTILIFLFITTTYAEVDKNLCNVSMTNEIKRVTPKNKPNYFFKTSPDGRYIFYISSGKNWRLDTQTGEESLLPGSADPVPSVDGKVLTSINWRVEGQKDWSLNLMPMRNWDIYRTRSGIVNNKSVTVDTSASRTYQSVGTLSNNKYRILSYQDGEGSSGSINVMDYKKRGKKIEKIYTTGFKTKVRDFRLPMISKDGSEFAGLDIKNNQTVIYKISKNGLGFDESDRLDFAAGKVDFSADNSKIVFHVTEVLDSYYAEDAPKEIEMPGLFDELAEVRNIFVYDRKSKSLTPVTQNKKGNSYYPVFLENNQVVYLDQRDGKFSFVYSAIPSESPKSIKKAEKCFEGDKFGESINKLAGLWQNVCTSWEGRGDASKLMTLGMSDKLCRQIAESSGDNNLSLMCEALEKSKITRPHVAKEKNSFKKMVKVKCMICHQGSIPFFDREKIKAHKSEIFKRINSKDPGQRMPPGAELSNFEKKEFEDYLNSL